MKRFSIFAACVALAAPLLLSGCGKNDKHPDYGGPQPPRDPKPEAYNAAVSGWAHFVDGDYAGALTLFDQSLQVEGDYLWALDGRGWSQLRMDNPVAAEATFDSALVHLDNWQDSASEADALVGKAFTASARGDYPAAAAAGTRAADVGGESYSFRGDPTITVDHPRLVAAEGYLRMGLYEQAYDMLVAIDVTVLERVNRDSAQFVQLLIEELQRISQGL